MTFQPEECTSDMRKNLSDLRVRELLGNHIPVEEAKLLSNGKITCLICLHRPIFDTTNMLAVHRRGKRHLSELEKFLKRKEELSLLDLKRKQQETKSDDQKPFLGFKAAKFKHVDKKRKPRLDIIGNSKSDTKSLVPRSASSQVKSYMKKSAKAQSFTEFVEEMRDGSSLSNTKEIGKQSLLKKPTRKAKSSKTVVVNEEIERRMSGWLKDASGNWIKDPEAEFDSDEETPNPFISS